MDDFTDFLHSAGNFILVILAWVMTYTGLPVEPAIILAVMMTIDFGAGVSRAYSLCEPITSHRIKVGVISKLGILSIPLLIALAAKGLGIDYDYLVQWSISFFILSELYSILANIYTARTGIPAPEFDAVAALLKKIRSLIDVMEKR